MKRIYCSFTLLLISAIAVSGQAKRNPLDGTWQAIEVVHTGPNAATIKPGPNLSIFSGTHYARVLVEANDFATLNWPTSIL